MTSDQVEGENLSIEPQVKGEPLSLNSIVEGEQHKADSCVQGEKSWTRIEDVNQVHAEDENEAQGNSKFNDEINDNLLW